MTSSVTPADFPAAANDGELGTRERLIDEALQLFLRNGYRETSVQQIVAAAQVTKGAFYHYFTSKENIILLAHQEYMENVLGTLRAIAEEPVDPAERLRLAIKRMVEGVASHRAQLALFLEQRRMLRGPRFKAVKQLRDEYEVEFIRLVEEGLEAGQYRADFDPRTVTLGIMGMLTWSYQWMRADSPEAVAAVGANLAGMVVDGLLAR